MTNSQQNCSSSTANGLQLVPVWLRRDYEKLGLLQTYGENRSKEPAKLSTSKKRDLERSLWSWKTLSLDRHCLLVYKGSSLVQDGPGSRLHPLLSCACLAHWSWLAQSTLVSPFLECLTYLTASPVRHCLLRGRAEGGPV